MGKKRVEKKPSNKLLFTGIAGTVIAALCCFTPVLVVLLGVLGLGAATGYLDFMLLPVLLVFIGMTLFALTKQKRACKAVAYSPKPGD